MKLQRTPSASDFKHGQCGTRLTRFRHCLAPKNNPFELAWNASLKAIAVPRGNSLMSRLGVDSVIVFETESI